MAICILFFIPCLQLQSDGSISSLIHHTVSFSDYTPHKFSWQHLGRNLEGGKNKFLRAFVKYTEAFKSPTFQFKQAGDDCVMAYIISSPEFFPNKSSSSYINICRLSSSRMYTPTKHFISFLSCQPLSLVSDLKNDHPSTL